MGTIMLVLIGATILEQFFGTDFVVRYIYTAPWTIALWAAAVVFGGWYIIRTIRQHAMRWAVVGIHVSFVVILTGALITHLWGDTGSLHLRLDKPISTYLHEDDRRRQLPFSVRLVDFEVEYYTGTQTAADYISTIEIADEIGQNRYVVRMNQIARHRGWRFYQSSYDDDGLGATLLLNHDPWGIGATYAGYLMLLISLLGWLLFEPRAKSQEPRRKCFGSGKRLSLFLILGSLLLSPIAYSQSPKTVQRPVAESFGDLYVEYNGRICPMSTLAHDVCCKLYGDPYYETEDGTRYTANQVLTGIMFYYDDWQKVPLKQTKKTIQNQERQNIFQMVGNGSLIKIWPNPTGWNDINNAGQADSLTQEEWTFRMYAMQYVAYDLAQGKNISANNTLEKIRVYQQKVATDLPSEHHFRAEQWFYRIPYTKPLAMASMTLGLLFFLLSCLYQARGKELPRWLRITMFVVMLLLWLFLTVMLLWRWYISGHIPMSNGHETMQLMAWLALLVGILSSITYSGSAASYRQSRPIVPSERPATRYASAILISAMALMVSMMTASNPQITLLMPVLQSPLLSMHVSVIMLSYTLFAFMMMNGVVGLFMSEAHQQRMAALNRRILRPAIACLAIGIFIGAVWANISWGRYWGWDPKEVWALITLLVYALPLHSRSLPLFQRPRVFLIYSIIAFAAVAFTYFGVNFLLGGMHSYA